MIDRYNRQELIENWDQTQLEQTRIALIGSGPLANFTAVCLTALGIGNLEIYSPDKVNQPNSAEFLQSGEPGQPKVQGLETLLRKINTSSRIKGLAIPLDQNLVQLLSQPDLIIDTTNSPDSKKTILKYGNVEEIPVISAVANSTTAEMRLGGKESLFKDYQNQPQGAVPSGILGGIITEEVRKIVMPLDDYDRPLTHLTYSLAADNRFSPNQDTELGEFNLENKKVLMVGAGALGNFAGLGLALQGLGRLDIMDFDEVDSTNLNRQVLFYGAVGELKAPALAERLTEIVPTLKARALVEKLDTDSKYFWHNKPDLIVDCVDSFAVRAIINYYAVRYQIPLVSGGTNPKSGQIVAYQPGKSSCLDCQLHVEKALAEQRQAASCKYTPDPSVIMTNQILGNMLVGEATKVLDSHYGEAVTKILKYDSNHPRRGGLVHLGDPCDCTKPKDVNTWLQQVDKLLEK